MILHVTCAALSFRENDFCILDGVSYVGGEKEDKKVEKRENIDVSSS